jgi:hypothetical protein
MAGVRFIGSKNGKGHAQAKTPSEALEIPQGIESARHLQVEILVRGHKDL